MKIVDHISYFYLIKSLKKDGYSQDTLLTEMEVIASQCPFEGGFIVSLLGMNEDDVGITVLIYDLIGRVIRNEIVHSSDFPLEINLADRNSGIYFLELINVSSNERISNHKIIQVE
jgi:type IX secretion system substrate protein